MQDWLNIAADLLSGQSTAPSSRSASLSRASSFAPTLVWNADEQRYLEQLLVRIVACGNLPLSFVENVQFRIFCTKYIPQAKIPSRAVLTQRILCTELEEWRAKSIARVMGQAVTLQCDGWTGLNNQHYVAFMITAHKEVWFFLIKNHCTSVLIQYIGTLCCCL